MILPEADDDELSKIDVSSYRGDKSKEKDQQAFRNDLKKFSLRNSNENLRNPLNKVELSKFIELSFKNYFNNWDLFRYNIINKQVENEIVISLVVDEPQLPLPLSSSKYLGKIISEEEKLRNEEARINQKREG